ncbi:hypothetical protein HUA74_20070 [Myxococcus sp. CA051A]|uniref:hypothetical protein n=1 Tax=unclassified Myxococcus TaxID=2648731 RepID=UPI00157B8098|nr:MULTISPECIES: hypothetical protein [unclassified Myxococcus]NTX01659.1 hypothetical protein [Myxococcus sp. CA040A]NTX62950.1 hypothetical protein [Myxococcus sp. CA051A]
MHIPLRLSSLLLAASLAAGCLGPETDTENLESLEQQATDPTFRVYNVVEAMRPAGNYDGVAGNECIALLNPEHRLRKIILVVPAGAGGSCALSAYTAGTALSFTWGDTSVYQGSAGIAAIRAALSDTNGAVHRLTGTLTSEAATLANLQTFLTLSDTQQATQLGTATSVDVHSLYDFEGQEEVYAEAAYQSVRVTQPCENPGSPQLVALVKNGFVYGYSASNTGSCHSGWFTRWRKYNRAWHLVAQYDYSE